MTGYDRSSDDCRTPQRAEEVAAPAVRRLLDFGRHRQRRPGRDLNPYPHAGMGVYAFESAPGECRCVRRDGSDQAFFSGAVRPVRPVRPSVGDHEPIPPFEVTVSCRVQPHDEAPSARHPDADVDAVEPTFSPSLPHRMRSGGRPRTISRWAGHTRAKRSTSLLNRSRMSAVTDAGVRSTAIVRSFAVMCDGSLPARTRSNAAAAARCAASSTSPGV
jgi:hypothetical protein